MIYANIIEHSRAGDVDLITFELQYPRFIHSEFMTHRVFSRNAMSSRAIPIAKMIEQVRNNPAMPIHWGAAQKGMQADMELSADAAEACRQLWLQAALDASINAQGMLDLGAHKQVANRILEPFQWMRTIVSATEWLNFYNLRTHGSADPNVQQLALLMELTARNSVPRDLGGVGQERWHLPFVTHVERAGLSVELLVKLSTARCARVSYLTHDKKEPSVDADVALYDRLVGAKPMHASPAEHQACLPGASSVDVEFFCGNFAPPFAQHRKLLEGHADIGAL